MLTLAPSPGPRVTFPSGHGVHAVSVGGLFGNIVGML